MTGEQLPRKFTRAELTLKRRDGVEYVRDMEIIPLSLEPGENPRYVLQWNLMDWGVDAVFEVRFGWCLARDESCS
jgi:hypothetical protein